jgi:signal transduction histidine kinase
MYHACHQVIKTGQAQRFESHCKEMGMWFSGTVSPDPDGVSVYLQDVTQEKKAQQKLLKQQEKLRSLALSLSVTEEQARRKIADVLHDDVGQSLISCKMMLETWERTNPDKNKEATINTVCNALESLIQKTHDLTFDLSYPTLFKFGLIAAIKEWIDNEIKAKHGLAVHIKDCGIPKGMDDKMEAFTFRAIKEIVFNVVKHAHAQQLYLQLDDADPFIHFMAKDDGIGFDYDTMQHSDKKLGGFGLFSIQERLEYLGGTFCITSKSGCGTQVNMKIPKTMPI